jgi:MFS transporter, DHA3 family, tetracycline resistance protein
VELGFPHDLVLWYTGLGILASATGVVALRIVEARIDGVRAARASYALACLFGTPGPVPATMHSFLSQAETLGEILGGGSLAALAQAAGIAATLLTAAALLAATGTLVGRNPVPLRK